jgi:Domain of unknown function (DUF4258)
MSERQINFTRHAADMLAERGIERGWVERVLDKPDVTAHDPKHENVFHAFRSIPERQGRVLRVVYSPSATEIRVITAFFDRSRRG